MSGMIMYPQSMRKKASEMLRELDSMDEKIEKFFKRYEEAQSPLELSGMAWSSVKSYIEDIQKPYLTAYKAWQNEQRDSLSIYSNAAGKLPDVHKLNKDQMENSIRKYRRYIEIEENRKNPNEDRIMRYEELIAEFEEKIQQMEDFAVSISGIFSEANAMQVALTGADNVLNSVKLTRTGTAIQYTSLSESEEMQAITVVANIYIIMSGGVSREKIRELEGMGFDKSSISKVFAASRDGGEKDMIIHFIKGDYKKAFTTANKDNGLVDSTAVFITEYLYRLGKKKNTDEEIQKVINAILESEDGINVKRAIACFTSLQFAAETLLEVDYIAAMRGARFMTGEEYGEIVNRNNRFKAVAILYGSTADIMSDAIIACKTVGFSISNISNLLYDDSAHTYSYHMKYKGLGIGAVDEKNVPKIELSLDTNVYTTLFASSIEVQSEMGDKHIKEMRSKKIEQDMGVFTDVMYAFGSAYGTTPYGMITMGAVSVQKASLGSYKSAYDNALKGLRDSKILENNLNKLSGTDTTLLVGNLSSVFNSYSNNSKWVNQAIDIAIKNKEAAIFYTGGGYSTEQDGETKLVLAGAYNLNTARALEVWRYEESYKDGELVDLKLGDLIKDENIMNQEQVNEIGKILEDDIKKANGNKAEVERRQKVLDVWNGDIDDIPIEELDKYFTSINKVCNDHLELYDISKKIDFRKVISEYEY